MILDPDAALVGGALDGDGWSDCALWDATLVGGVGTLSSLACSRWTVMSTVEPAVAYGKGRQQQK